MNSNASQLDSRTEPLTNPLVRMLLVVGCIAWLWPTDAVWAGANSASHADSLSRDALTIPGMADRHGSVSPSDHHRDFGPMPLAGGDDCVPDWSPFGSRPAGFEGPSQGQVRAITVFDDGSGPAVYIGGYFTSIGGEEIRRIARWQNGVWSAVGGGLNGGGVRALEVFDDGTGPALYAAGDFTAAGGAPANRIARWDGHEWSPLGSGTNDTIHTLSVFDDGSGPALYAGGRFTTASGAPARRIAKWDGSTWSRLGTGLSQGTWGPTRVEAITVFDDGTGPALYAAGNFTVAGGVATYHIARWDGNEWSVLGDGLCMIARALAVFDDGSGPALYVGGAFQCVWGVGFVNRIAKWDGNEWSGLGPHCPGSVPDGCGVNHDIYAMAVFDDGTGPALYVGGHFTWAGGMPEHNRIARWDGEEWSALSIGVEGIVFALHSVDLGSGSAPQLLVGGAFNTASGVEAEKIARWDGSSWFALHNMVNLRVISFEVFDDGSGPALYAGGEFTTASGATVNHIARWDGSSWSPVGDGLSGPVVDMTVFDDGSGPALYASGWFTTAGGVQVNNIAKWDGSSWSPLGGGMNNPVYALTVFDDGTGPALYAGGGFTTAGGVTANRIAKWDGDEWSSLGSGMSGCVGHQCGSHLLDLAVFDDGSGPALYASGNFTTVDGESIDHIARWDGSSWSPVGGGMNNTVFALTVFDDGSGPALYAGGQFTTAGIAPANGIAKWNGIHWLRLDDGLNGGTVHELTVFDDGTGLALYVGGQFTSASGVTVNRIAKWNGEAWSAVGTGCPGSPSEGCGMGGAIWALEVFDDGTGPALFVGGNHTTSPAGDRRIAKYQGCPVEPECDLADLNCDGVVDVDDLFILLSVWGPCADCGNCPADINGDCVVDVDDLFILLANWG